jgi:Flp pilus assembly protein TadD
MNLRVDPYAEGLRLSAHGDHMGAIVQFEQALARAPDDPRVLFALGNTARSLGLARPAEAFFRQVLAKEPARLEALVNLANLLRTEGRFGEAEALLVPALSRCDAAELWLTLGSTYREMGDAARAATHYRGALARRADYAEALVNLADLVADDGRTEEALALYGRAIALKPNESQPRLNRAVLHLLSGDLAAGWSDYEARLALPGKVPVADHGLPRWDGTPLEDRRLLVTAEQGIGDQVMFASMIGELCATGSVVLECEPRLVTLFARSFPRAAVHAWEAETRGGIARTGYGWLEGADCAIPMGSLPQLLRATHDAFPAPNAYLVPDAQEVSRWRFDGPALGICWRSGKTGGHRAQQHAPLEAWAAFVRDWPGDVVSVQYDATADEIAALERMSGREIVVPEGIDQKNELDRACALLGALDAVASAPTAVSWLAAAAGVPTFKLLYDTSWTSFATGFEPFAPSCICVMPRRRGDWTDVFAKTQDLLSARFS